MTRTVETRIFNSSIIGKYLLSTDVDVCALSGVPDMVSEMSAFRIQPTAHACSNIIVLYVSTDILIVFSHYRYIPCFRREKIRPPMKAFFDHFVIPKSYINTKKTRLSVFCKIFFLYHIELKYFSLKKKHKNQTKFL